MATEPGQPPRVLGEAIQDAPGHTRAFVLIEEALQRAHWEREAIDCLAIGLGPGSYTGIRMAISIAQGWQLARAVKLVGINSVECLAAQVHTEGTPGRVHIAIDAQRNEFYLATYAIETAAARAEQALSLATLAEVQAALATGGTLVGPDVQRWFPAARLACPRAATLGLLAAGRADFVPGEQLEPVYLRATTFVKAPPPRVIPED